MRGVADVVGVKDGVNVDERDASDESKHGRANLEVALVGTEVWP